MENSTPGKDISLEDIKSKFPLVSKISGTEHHGRMRLCLDLTSV